MRSNSEYAVVTGASKGLGKEMAKALARRGYNLVLVALPNEKLAEAARDLASENGIDVKYYECDLTLTDEAYKLIDWIKGNFAVSVLINNAGFGCTRKFLDLPNGLTDQMVLLNVRATVLLTYGLLPLLEKQKQAFILNIASLASFSPMPFKSIYPASKAFVYSFSRGLNAEYMGTNVSVSVAHPGGLPTNADVRKRIASYNGFIKSTILSVESTAEICIRQMLRKRSLIIPGFMNKIYWLFLKIAPVWVRMHYFRFTLRKEIKPPSKTRYA